MSTRPRGPLLLKVLGALIGLVGRITPRRARSEWKQEWRAELDHRWSLLESTNRLDWRTKADLLYRTAGALIDAAWLRRQFTADAEWVQDTRHALRVLRVRPAFTATAVATLAVGIGANTAVFTLVDATLLRPLPYPGADRIVTVWERRGGSQREEVAPTNFLDWRERLTSFESLAAAEPYAYDYTDGQEPESLFAIRVTEDFFRVVGMAPLVGRAFERDDYIPGRERVAVLSHALWQRLYAGDRGIVGRPVRLDGQVFTVVGVMPPEFQLRLLPTAGERGVWTPKIFEDYERRMRLAGYWNALGRLKPGVTLSAAQAELESVAAQLAREFPRTNAATSAELVPLREHLAGDVRLPFLAMLGAVVVVLTIACANVSAMTLARGMQRTREFAIRSALGAGRARLVRQLVTEAFAIAALAAIGGVAVAEAALRAAVAHAPSGLPPLRDISIDGRALAFAVATTAFTALLVAIVPALRLSSSRAGRAMRERGPRATGRHGSGVLIAGEVTLATVLLVAAGLLTRSFVRLVSVDTGFTRENIAVLQVFVYDRHDTPAQKRQFFDETTARLRGVAGVKEVGAVSALPFIPANIGIRSGVTIHGRPAPPPAEQIVAYVTVATPTFFNVLRVPLLAGRPLVDADGPTSPRVALINDVMRRRYWPEENPLGQRATVRFEGKPVEVQIVGVVGNLRHDGFDRAARPELFVPFAQQPFGSMTLVVRTADDPAVLMPELKRQIWVVDPLQTFYQTSTMEALVDDSVAARRFSAAVIASFALIALALAATGIYGVISMSTAQRTQEIGVRIALGADRRRILRLIVGEGVVFVVAGLALGSVISLLVTRSLAKLLFGITPGDPATFAFAASVLACAGVVASYLPARRATRVDPLVALRVE